MGCMCLHLSVCVNSLWQICGHNCIFGVPIVVLVGYLENLFNFVAVDLFKLCFVVCINQLISAFLCFHLSQDSNTALHIAAKLGNTEALRTLLRGGANPHLMNVVRDACIYHL